MFAWIGFVCFMKIIPLISLNNFVFHIDEMHNDNVRIIQFYWSCSVFLSSQHQPILVGFFTFSWPVTFRVMVKTVPIIFSPCEGNIASYYIIFLLISAAMANKNSLILIKRVKNGFCNLNDIMSINEKLNSEMYQ